jgi:hypothetical protein
MTHSIKCLFVTLGIMTFRIMTLSIKGSFETLSINDTQHNDIQNHDTQHRGLIYDNKHKCIFSITSLCYYAECCHVQCSILFTVMLIVIVISVINL